MSCLVSSAVSETALLSRSSEASACLVSGLRILATIWLYLMLGGLGPRYKFRDGDGLAIRNLNRGRQSGPARFGVAWYFGLNISTHLALSAPVLLMTRNRAVIQAKPLAELGRSD